jgi:uncharacterized protein (DUF1501 family)
MKRRNFIQVGGLATIGLSLGDYLKAQQNYTGKDAKIKSVINVFLPGGIAAQESWDPKPLAPAEYKGPLKAIETAVPEIQLSELMPNVARVMDKATIIRSMTHGEAAHERGTHNMFTGWKPSPALQYPSMGSIVSHELGNKNNMPSYVSIPNQPNEFAGTGFLSTKFGTFGLGSDPANSDFKVRDLTLPDNITVDRFDRRRNLLELVDAKFKSAEKDSDAIKAVDEFYGQAFSMISSREAIESFDLNKESSELRAKYGHNQAGQRFLMARRLVEAGTRFVTVTYGSWDHHDNVLNGMNSNVPALDQALGALIEDLDDRDLLKDTLVLVTSEFGRTPKINRTAGRDHWPRVFSTFIAGGPVKKGFAYGRSDDLSNAVDENPVSPGDISATVFDLLGIDPEKRLMTADLRPINITPGKIISDILVG